MDKKCRTFGESFKRSKVEEIEQKKVTVNELSRAYDVSATAIYRWIYQYGKNTQGGLRMTIEKDTDTVRTLALQKQVAGLERLLGQKQVEIEYLNKVIEKGGELYDCDLKKKCEPKS